MSFSSRNTKGSLLLLTVPSVRAEQALSEQCFLSGQCNRTEQCGGSVIDSSFTPSESFYQVGLRAVTSPQNLPKDMAPTCAALASERYPYPIKRGERIGWDAVNGTWITDPADELDATKLSPHDWDEKFEPRIGIWGYSLTGRSISATQPGVDCVKVSEVTDGDVSKAEKLLLDDVLDRVDAGAKLFDEPPNGPQGLFGHELGLMERLYKDYVKFPLFKKYKMVFEVLDQARLYYIRGAVLDQVTGTEEKSHAIPWHHGYDRMLHNFDQLRCRAQAVANYVGELNHQMKSSGAYAKRHSLPAEAKRLSLEWAKKKGLFSGDGTNMQKVVWVITICISNSWYKLAHTLLILLQDFDEESAAETFLQNMQGFLGAFHGDILEITKDDTKTAPTFPIKIQPKPAQSPTPLSKLLELWQDNKDREDRFCTGKKALSKVDPESFKNVPDSLCKGISDLQNALNLMIWDAAALFQHMVSLVQPTENNVLLPKQTIRDMYATAAELNAITDELSANLKKQPTTTASHRMVTVADEKLDSGTEALAESHIWKPSPHEEYAKYFHPLNLFSKQYGQQEEDTFPSS